ncbi:MAG: hypothetical protein JNK32_09430 [Anaerolineales bacterium]|nr:hypothetical protein [Anaerolineales bacterium]
MQNDKSLSLFKCPSCGAPLEPETGTPTMKCPYCGASIVIPETLRTPEPSSGHASLSDVTELAKQGKLDEAARIYSKITGLSHEYALISVKSMAGIRDEEPASSGPEIIRGPQVGTNYQTPPSVQVPSQPRVKVRGGSCISIVIRLVVLISILSAALPSLIKALPFKLPTDLPGFSEENPIIPVPFAKEVISFSPSSSKDPRAIGVDGDGNILVFNYNSSDIQIFDPEGNETSLMAITESNGRKLNNSSMAVSRDGTIYVPGFQSILVFNENAERLREIRNEEELFIIYSVTVGSDDKVYVRSNTGIIRLNENGEVDLKISEETIEEVSGESPGFGAIGADAQGNIYFSGSINTDVLKFSPNGEFISSFGGDFNSVRQIAFDGYGRIYVVDFFDVKVYDSNYGYINQIDGSFWGVDFDSQNYMYGVTTQTDNIVKYEIQKPGSE